MIFNSLQFLFFFPVVFITYYLLPHKFRWFFLLLSSYFFYASFEPSYLLLLIFSTLISYYACLKIDKTSSKKIKKRYLYATLIANLGLLLTFKYFNFFSGSFSFFSESTGLKTQFPEFKYLLPIGISFYTFQVVGYCLDVYHGKIKPERHLGFFALFVSFFPQLVAGPIERAERLLPRLKKKFTFNYEKVTSGLRLMAWGFFQKIVIADRLAVFVNHSFENKDQIQGFQVLLVLVFFSFQILLDFSGYTDIARGAARIFGVDLIKNFKSPYLSKSISEFWRRWHISLSFWFRDYIYIPLGGNRTIKWRWSYNILIVFLISGLWHGAAWTFVFWGLLHGVYIITGDRTAKLRASLWKKIGLQKFVMFKNIWQTLVTFSLVCFAWLFFRAETFSDALILLQRMFLLDFSHIRPPGNGRLEFSLSFLLIGVFIIIEAIKRKKPIQPLIMRMPVYIRFTIYLILILLILNIGVFGVKEFIYFQF